MFFYTWVFVKSQNTLLKDAFKKSIMVTYFYYTFNTCILKENLKNEELKNESASILLPNPWPCSERMSTFYVFF